MGTTLNPYLSFRDNAREAMTFYSHVFGGELTVSTFAEFGDAGPASDLVMHASLTTPAGYTLMASDTPPGMEYAGAVTGASLSLSGDDAEALRGYWDQLSGSGSVTMPLQKQVWGDEFGMCIDRYGVPWLVNISAG